MLTISISSTPLPPRQYIHEIIGFKWILWKLQIISEGCRLFHTEQQNVCNLEQDFMNKEHWNNFLFFCSPYFFRSSLFPSFFFFIPSFFFVPLFLSIFILPLFPSIFSPRFSLFCLFIPFVFVSFSFSFCPFLLFLPLFNFLFFFVRVW